MHCLKNLIALFIIKFSFVFAFFESTTRAKQGFDKAELVEQFYSWNEWSPWSKYHVHESWNLSIRLRYCQGQNYSQCECGSLYKRECREQVRESNSPVIWLLEGTWTDWSVVTNCTCGIEKRKLSRNCIVNGNITNEQACKDVSSVKEEMCPITSCNFTANWTEWSEWSCKSKKDGLGVRKRYRECMNFTGGTCPGSNKETGFCHDREKYIPSYYSQMRVLSLEFLRQPRQAIILAANSTSLALSCNNTFRSVVDDFYSNYSIVWSFKGQNVLHEDLKKTIKYKLKTKLLSKTKNKTVKVNESDLVITNPDGHDSGVYICFAVLSTELNENVMLEFKSVVIEHDLEIKESDPLIIKCNFFELTSIFSQDQVIILIKKDGKLLKIKNLSLEESKRLNEYSLEEDNLIARSANSTHSGHYEFIFMHLGMNWSLVTNRVQLEVQKSYVIDSDSTFMRSAFVLAIVYACLLMFKLVFDIMRGGLVSRKLASCVKKIRQSP